MAASDAVYAKSQATVEWSAELPAVAPAERAGAVLMRAAGDREAGGVLRCQPGGGGAMSPPSLVGPCAIGEGVAEGVSAGGRARKRSTSVYESYAGVVCPSSMQAAHQLADHPQPGHPSISPQQQSATMSPWQHSQRSPSESPSELGRDEELTDASLVRKCSAGPPLAGVRAGATLMRAAPDAHTPPCAPDALTADA